MTRHQKLVYAYFIESRTYAVESTAVMDITINRTGLKLFVIVAVIVACYLFIDNNPEVQESIKEVLRTIYLID